MRGACGSSARLDPRRRTYAVGTYAHVLDQWGILYHQPIVLNRRQAGAAIEGALRQRQVGQLERVAVDTHGFTHFAMALAKVVGNESGLGLDPHLPEGWRNLAFSVQWRGRHISVSVDADRETIQATLTSGEPMAMTIDGERHPLAREAPLTIPFVAKCMAPLPAVDGLHDRTPPRWHYGPQQIHL